MLFTQYVFFVFLTIVVAGNYFLYRFASAQKIALIAASLVFFLSWGGSDVALFVVMLVVNYPLALAIHSTGGRWRVALLWGAIVLDVGTLLYFKYAGIFLDLAGFLLDFAGIALPPATVWAPLGLSFYTFHLLSFHIDLYQRKCTPGRFIDYVGYISFFPHLIAGPIVRSQQLMPQFASRLTPSRFDWSGGIQAFSIGLFLKCTADVIAIAVDADWTAVGAEKLSAGDAWATAFLFSCQIFGDFAGYSYMAIGMSRFLGYELPVNFNAPYLAASFREFWHRWHITLSRFLRDYLYVLALGGNRLGQSRAHLNTMITMLLGGLWHGANWTFVAWGGLHGAALVIERFLGFHNPSGRTGLTRLAWYVFVQVVVIMSWVLFRSPDFSVASTFIGKMLDISDVVQIDAHHLNAMALGLPVIGYHLVRFAGERVKFDYTATAGVISAALLYCSLILLNLPAKFIYFEF